MALDFGIGGPLGLKNGRVAAALATVLKRRGDEPGRVVAVGDELGRALGRVGLDVVCVSEVERKKKKGIEQVVAQLGALPFGDESVMAVFVAGALPAGIAALTEFARVVHEGGMVAVATPGPTLGRKIEPPEVLAAQLLHAALADIEQFDVGTTRVSAGTVRRWGRPVAQALRPAGP